jgi:hypothetical protein
METDPLLSVAHRPWPLPDGPWIMGQRWNDLLFMHWPVEVEKLRALVPRQLELDLRQNTAWVSIAPFSLTHLRARGTPALPWVSAFLETNVRTYVTMDGRPGVYFFSLDATSALAVIGARALFHLPYELAAMRLEHRADGAIDYQSRRKTSSKRATLHVAYAPDGDVRHAAEGSLDHWLTERYCLYSVDDRARVYRVEIHHAPWPLQSVNVELLENTMAAAANIALPPAMAPRTAFARRLDVVLWPKQRVA